MTWMIIRGSGLAAFGLLALSTIWGLLLSTGLVGRLVKAKPLTYMHESLAVGAILATVIHLGGLALDEFFEFGWQELLVPGASPYEPLWVTFGLVAFYGMVVASGSFYVRKHIGQKAWRYVHFSTFGTYAAAAVHGIMAGTDSTNPYVFAGYVGSAALVMGLVAVRIALGGVTARPAHRLRSYEAAARTQAR
jgi:DMSO/TMAO reductase YedYZ heme-binding membrane subunit